MHSQDGNNESLEHVNSYCVLQGHAAVYEQTYCRCDGDLTKMKLCHFCLSVSLKAAVETGSKGTEMAYTVTIFFQDR